PSPSSHASARPAAPARPFERREGRLVGEKIALDVTNGGRGLISRIDLLDEQFHDEDGNTPDLFLLGDNRTLELSFDGKGNQLDLKDAPQHVTALDDRSITVQQTKPGAEVTQRLTLTEGYEAEYVVTVTNTASTPTTHRLNLITRLGASVEEDRYDLHRTLCLQGEEMEDRDTSDFQSGGGCNPFGGGGEGEIGEEQRVMAPTQWTGVSTNFFAQLTVPDGFSAAGCAMNTEEDRTQYSTLIAAKETLDPGERRTYRFGLFLGPKFEGDLIGFKAVEGASLKRAIDWGWFGGLSEYLGGWMLSLLRWFYSLTGIWGVAIILLTVVVRVAMLPLTLKQMNSMKAMKKAQPELNAIKEKYKDDKMKQHQEMQAAMARAGANPLAGCFPLLLQFPVFIALYASLQAAVELYHVPFLWVPDLTSQDPYYILPLAMGAVMYLQTKLQPTPAADNEQAKMMQTLMPVIFTVMMLFLPAGLTVYIFASTVIGVIQTLIFVRPNSSYAGTAHAPHGTPSGQ
ncbi:MAG: YidC/Oxa1 family insertase periplasmic-domain containing protein, partial [Nannocystaceae bacterium]